MWRRRIFLGDGFYCTKNMYMQYIDFFFFSVAWCYKCAISIFYLSHVKDADMIMYLFCCGNNHLYSEVNKCFFLIISSHLKWETSRFYFCLFDVHVYQIYLKGEFDETPFLRKNNQSEVKGRITGTSSTSFTFKKKLV